MKTRFEIVLKSNVSLSRYSQCMVIKMDPLAQFKKIINEWIGVIARIAGHDLDKETKEFSAYTVMTISVAISFPCIYSYTIYNYDGDLRFSGIAYYGAAVQVIF